MLVAVATMFDQPLLSVDAESVWASVKVRKAPLADEYSPMTSGLLAADQPLEV